MLDCRIYSYLDPNTGRLLYYYAIIDADWDKVLFVSRNFSNLKSCKISLHFKLKSIFKNFEELCKDTIDKLVHL